MAITKLTPRQIEKFNQNMTKKQEMTLDKIEIKEMCGDDAKAVMKFYKRNRKDIDELYSQGRPHPIPSLAYSSLIVSVFYELRKS